MEIKYENSLFYQINSTAKYFDKLFDQFFKELNLGITGTEHLALCVVMQTKNCCLRDLAKIILKDRANTGKLAYKLEKMGLVNIELKTKENKLVKILTVTERGKEVCETAYNKIFPLVEQIKTEVTQEKIEDTIKNLVSFRQTVKKVVKMDI